MSPEVLRDASAPRPLTPADLEVLEFARIPWTYEGARCHAILDRFGCSAAIYSQRLNALLDHPAAFAYDPPTVRRLRRLRDARRTYRTRGVAG